MSAYKHELVANRDLFGTSSCSYPFLGCELLLADPNPTQFFLANIPYIIPYIIQNSHR